MRLRGDHGILGADLGEAFLRKRLRLLRVVLLLTFAHHRRFLRQDHLDVARRRHVRVGAAVGTVGAAALLLGAVDLDVRDEERLGVETLDLCTRSIERAERG